MVGEVMEYRSSVSSHTVLVYLAFARELANQSTDKTAPLLQCA
jgi:hypothetical protein